MLSIVSIVSIAIIRKINLENVGLTFDDQGSPVQIIVNFSNLSQPALASIPSSLRPSFQQCHDFRKAEKLDLYLSVICVTN